MSFGITLALLRKSVVFSRVLSGSQQSEVNILQEYWLNFFRYDRLVFICFFCPFIIMKKFVQLMLYFYWLESTWQRADISRYSSYSKKMIVFFVNLEKPENWKPKNIRRHITKYLQTAFRYGKLHIHRKVTSCHCKINLFFYVQLFQICKNYSHIWNQLPQICLITKLREKNEYLNLGPKIPYLGNLGIELEKPLSYIKSTPFNLSNCKIL